MGAARALAIVSVTPRCPFRFGTVRPAASDIVITTGTLLFTRSGDLHITRAFSMHSIPPDSLSGDTIIASLIDPPLSDQGSFHDTPHANNHHEGPF